MSVDVEVPQPFDANLGLSGAVDFDLDNIHLSVDSLPQMTVSLTSNNQINTESQLTLNSDNTLDGKLSLDTDVAVKSNSTVDVDTDSKIALNSDSKVELGLDNIRVQALPQIKFELGIRPLRVRFPIRFNWRFKLLGIEVCSLDLCGESSLAVENLNEQDSETPS